MKNKFLSLVLSSALVLSVLTGCSSSNSDNNQISEMQNEEKQEDVSVDNSEETTSEENSSDSGLQDASQDESSESNVEKSETVMDRSGNEIVLPDEVNSIISMAPSITRVLLDIGLGDKIIACDTYSYGSYGEELNEDIPQFDMMTPDQEQIISLGADVIFTTGMSLSGGSDVYEAVRESGVCITDIPSSASLKDIEDDISFIGMVVGESDKTDAIVSEMEDTINEIKAIAETIPEEEKKSVLFELYTPSADNPVIYTAGNGTYINEMLEVIGANNVAASTDEQWPALSEEAAIGMNPNVILTADMYTEDVINVILGMDGWSDVSAIVNGDVYQLSSDEVNQPNQHVISAMKEMAEAIYPGKYSFTESGDVEESDNAEEVDDAA